jgi:hypothetical protein
VTNPRPILLGYIRADMLGTADVAAATDRLETFASNEKYTLGTVYIEQGTDTSALEALLDEAERSEDAWGLVVPDGRHLSSTEDWVTDGITVFVAMSSP